MAKLTDKQKRFLEALDANLGIITQAAKATRISRRSYYNWLDIPEFKRRVDEINQSTVDFVESKLLQNINNADTTAIIFYLKTKAKDRGYVERVENMNKVVDEFDGYSDEELDKELDRLRKIQDEEE